MSWDLATAKGLLSISSGDLSKDAAINTVRDVVLDTVENLLGRRLLLARETVTFYYVTTRKLLLPRYPIRAVHTINGETITRELVYHSRVGWVYSDNFFGQQEVKIDYEGGYDPLPPMLERALWEAFMFLWNKTNQTTGGPNVSGGGASVVQGSGDVSSISLTDFGTVRFDVGAQIAAGADQAEQADLQKDWGWLAPWASTLQIFRSEEAPTVAFA